MRIDSPSSLNAFDRMLAPGRLRALWPVLVAFMVFNLLVRLGLVVTYGDGSLWLPWRLVPALLIGALFDIGAATFVLAPMAWIVAALPGARGRVATVILGGLLLILAGVLVFVGAAEFTFWNEFASRFNFIAVDYLIYTNEVVGNIRESYNLPLMLAAVGVLALAVWLWVMRHVAPRLQTPRAPWTRTLVALAIWSAAPLATWAALDARYKEFSSDAQLNELAGNGYFDFWHAFWHNEIDYDRFYKTMDRSRALAVLAEEMHIPVVQGRAPSDLMFERDVTHPGPEKSLNVVLVSVESLSASFLGTFGNTQGITPRLDALAKDSLLFTKLYATGTRTVRGLEALSLSIPPTPGHSIVKRPRNDHLFSIGSVFASKGYEPLYIYGGYGYFDNMSAFFSGNGYTVVDRTALASTDIHFENIWGVADEDLFTLTLRELDARAALGKKFFAHVMTTSNHRPYTYPEGRIDIPSKTGREGGVKYTDWAIGNFIDRAREKPWFKDTIFVIVADHTHNGRGKSELPPQAYHIPMLVYSPAHVQPGRVDSIASQIDVAPTLLGLLNFNYRSRFFGQDILREGQSHPRALMANYQTVGYLEDGVVVELKPNSRVRVADAATGATLPDTEQGRRLVEEAVAYYQIASQAFRRGDLRKQTP